MLGDVSELLEHAGPVIEAHDELITHLLMSVLAIGCLCLRKLRLATNTNEPLTNAHKRVRAQVNSVLVTVSILFVGVVCENVVCRCSNRCQHINGHMNS